MPHHFEDTAHQVADMAEDKGARRVQSRGLAFVPRATAAAALEGGPRPAVTDILFCTFEVLSQEDKAFDGALDWMQSSFTAQSDGTYVGRIRTRREPTEVTSALGLYRYLALLAPHREFFPGQYLPGGGDEDGLDSEAPRLQGGGLRDGKDPGYGTADSGDALPGTKDGVQAMAAELRAEAESERAADAWAKVAVTGNGASTCLGPLTNGPL